jgi:hypothetical protein
MKILIYSILFFCFTSINAQDLTFKYLVVFNEKTDDYKKGVYGSTFRFNENDSGDIWLYMDNTPASRLTQISNPVHRDEYYTARYLMMGKEMDLFIYDNGNIILRNISNKKYMLFTNHNDLNSKK